jgi:ribosomal protein S18 acetylase RimI-like enzyme
MHVRTGQTEEEITAAIRIDASLASTRTRSPYITAVAERGGLRLIEDQERIVGFCCLDDRYFFEKVFVSLLIVDAGARRRGIGQELLQAAAMEHPEIWTSTNRSNMAMRGLLTKTGWMFCGEIAVWMPVTRKCSTRNRAERGIYELKTDLACAQNQRLLSAESVGATHQPAYLTQHPGHVPESLVGVRSNS